MNDTIRLKTILALHGVTVAELAARFRLTPSDISRTINGHPRTEGERERVLDAIAQLVKERGQ